MRQGQPLGQLTSDLEYMIEHREDLVVGTDCLTAYPPDPIETPGLWRLHINTGTPEMLEMTDSAMNQLTNISGPSPRDVREVRAGTTREKLTLAKYITVRLQERPSQCTIRVVPRGFWEPNVVAAIVPPEYEAKSGLAMLAQLLSLSAATNGIQFESGHVDTDWLRVTLVQPTNGKNGGQLRAGLTMQYSEAGHTSSVFGVLMTQFGHLIVVGDGRSIGWTELTEEMVTEAVAGAMVCRTKYARAKGITVKGVNIEHLFAEFGINLSTARAIAKQVDTTRGESAQMLIDHIAKHAETSKTLSDRESWEMAHMAGALLSYGDDAFDLFRDKPLPKAKAPRKAVTPKANGKDPVKAKAKRKSPILPANEAVEAQPSATQEG